MQDIRVLVTGGAGFIGSRLVGGLSRRGAKSWVFDNLLEQVHGDNGRSPILPRGAVFVRGDVTDASHLNALLREVKPDLVYHLAAETGTSQSLDEPARYCRVNVLGTAHLIEAMRSCGSPIRRLVLASSRAIYGEGAYSTSDGRLVVPPARTLEAMSAGRYHPEFDGEGPLKPRPSPEDLPLRPCSVYASTKLMQEHLALQSEQVDPWDVTILRLQNVYGPGQSLRNPYTGVLSIFARVLSEGGSLDVFEDGEIVRDFVYVDDVVEAMIAAGEHVGGPFVMNIGSGEARTILQTARELAKSIGRSAEAVRVTGSFRPGDVRYAVADITRARQQLGWAPKTSFTDGMAALIGWAATHT